MCGEKKQMMVWFCVIGLAVLAAVLIYGIKKDAKQPPATGKTSGIESSLEEIKPFRSLGKKFTELMQIPPDHKRKTWGHIFDYWYDKGFSFSSASRERLNFGDIEFSDQLKTCPWLKINVVSTERALSNIGFYGCRQLGGIQHSYTGYRINKRILPFKGFIVPSLNQELSQQVINAKHEGVPESMVVTNNFLIGDYLCLGFINFCEKDEFGKRQYAFSKDNPYVVARIPQDAEGGMVYEHTFDIKAAVDFERAKILQEKK